MFGSAGVGFGQPALRTAIVALAETQGGPGFWASVWDLAGGRQQPRRQPVHVSRPFPSIAFGILSTVSTVGNATILILE